MAFKSKTPPKALRQKTPLKSKTSLTSRSSLSATPLSHADQIKAQKKALQKATLRALDKAKSAASEAGVELSPWETEFIQDVSERVKTYGRAFADPDKGAINGTLSLRQGLKLKEIRKKVKSRNDAPKGDQETD